MGKENYMLKDIMTFPNDDIFLEIFLINVNGDLYINNLTKCNKLEDLEFKSIYADIFFSAGITTSGELYIWGKKMSNSIGNIIQNPCLIKNESNLPIFVDQIALNGNNLLSISRIL